MRGFVFVWRGMGPRMLRVLGFGALALRGYGLGTAGWGLVCLLAVVVLTFLELEAEVEGDCGAIEDVED